MHSRQTRLSFYLLLPFCCSVLGFAVLGFVAPKLAPAADDAPDFSRRIKPILVKRCFSCHGPDKAEGGLRLNDQKSAHGELDSGEVAVLPGKPEESALIARVLSREEGERMPPEGEPLKPEEVALLKSWIAHGGKWELHWAFRPRGKPAPPAVSRTGWVRNPIDAFILARLEKAGLAPAPPAGKVALIRRATQNLTGLPPSPQEVQDFVNDASENAYEKVVDRLLESPHYGEHWARHWLDVVRFAETNSYERDGPKPNAWKYRDYVIRSLNDDKPYDQFVREQLAGDELPKPTVDSITATGYYRLGVWDDEPADPLLARYDELDGILTTTAQAFLGLTINCARCHDHKIDPIPQADYYRMLAFFQGLRSYGTRADQTSFNQTEISPPALQTAYQQVERRERALDKSMRDVEQRGIVKMPAEEQRKTETNERQQVLKDKLQEFLDETEWKQYEVLRAEREAVRRQRSQLAPREMVLSVARCIARPPPTHIMLRGNPHVPGAEVGPGFPHLFDSASPEISPPAPGAKTSGRRIVLADWITSPENRLTARVIVNRLWQHQFGRGIVRSPNNFGQIGVPPTHPLLLDWLAENLVQGGWRLKRFHKQLMMSAAYRMSSQGNDAGLKKDPANDLFWRFNMRRLSAEEIRDAIHFVSGRLNAKMYGPGIYPDISPEVLAGQSRPGEGWGKSSLEEQARRSVYIHVKRSLITPILANFDFPETDASCEARFATTQPSQALGMLNGAFAQREAAFFAERLVREAGEDRAARVGLALQLALCRQPEQVDIDWGVGLIESLIQKHQRDEKQALTQFCLIVLNLNEFLYLD